MGEEEGWIKMLSKRRRKESKRERFTKYGKKFNKYDNAMM